MNVLLASSDRRPDGSSARSRDISWRSWSTTTNRKCLAAALRASYDLLLLDAEIASSGGAALCRRLRESDVQTPIIVLSATGDAAEAAQTIDAGADDVVPRSVTIPELLARVRAVRRRDLGTGDGGLQVGDLRLDVSLHAAVRGTEVIDLTAKEFQLLDYLLRRQGQVVRREEIRRALWPDNHAYSSNLVDLYIHYLRDKIERSDKAPLIRTVRGVGYMLQA